MYRFGRSDFRSTEARESAGSAQSRRQEKRSCSFRPDRSVEVQAQKSHCSCRFCIQNTARTTDQMGSTTDENRDEEDVRPVSNTTRADRRLHGYASNPKPDKELNYQFEEKRRSSGCSCYCNSYSTSLHRVSASSSQILP